jgi:hypothetical protein
VGVKKVRVLGAALGALLLLGACSGGSNAKQSSSSGGDAADFCADARDIVANLGGNVFTDPRGVQRIVGRVEALTPPAELADKWPAFVAYVQQLATIAPRDPDAASKALDALQNASADVTAVGTYLVETCKVDAAASDLTDFSDIAPRS